MAEDGSTKDELGGVASPQAPELPKEAPFTEDLAPSLQKEFGKDKVRTHPNQEPPVDAATRNLINTISSGVIPESAPDWYKDKIISEIEQAHPGIPTQPDEIRQAIAEGTMPKVGELAAEPQTVEPAPKQQTVKPEDIVIPDWMNQKPGWIQDEYRRSKAREISDQKAVSASHEQVVPDDMTVPSNEGTGMSTFDLGVRLGKIPGTVAGHPDIAEGYRVKQQRKEEEKKRKKTLDTAKASGVIPTEN